MKKLAEITKSTLAGVVLILVLGSLTGGCTKSSDNGSKGPGANEVFIQNMSFDPSTITVTQNTTITWTNKDAITHTVTSDNSLFDSGNIPPNGTYSHTFSTVGTFPYHFTIHPTMTAEVKVNRSSGY